MLEVIKKGSTTESHPVPMLFVHGAWHAAWCWDEHFQDFFADMGYRAVALSMRGRGSSPAPKALRWCSLADDVDDVAEVAARLPTQPVLIGHSMGGFVVQKYLEHHTAAGSILMQSVPPTGVLPVNAYQSRLQDESYLAFLGMLAIDLVKTKRIDRVPMLVLGAGDDTVISEPQIRRTEAAYGVEAEMFTDIGHDVMLEPGWHAVAERIDGWLKVKHL